MSILDAVLKPDGLTAKQWMLLVSIESLGPEAPTLGQTARRYGASHQAVRDVAVRLERRGFLELRRDAHDRRSRMDILCETSSNRSTMSPSAELHRFCTTCSKPLSVTKARRGTMADRRLKRSPRAREVNHDGTNDRPDSHGDS